MSTDLSVSMNRGGIVVEIQETTQVMTLVQVSKFKYDRVLQTRRGRLLGATLSPDEARTIASELNDAADRFEAESYQFPSRSIGGPR